MTSAALTRVHLSLALLLIVGGVLAALAKAGGPDSLCAKFLQRHGHIGAAKLATGLALMLLGALITLVLS